MAKKSKKTYTPKEEEKEPVIEEPKVEQEHILKADLNRAFRKGDKVSHDRYLRLIDAGFKHLFE